MSTPEPPKIEFPCPDYPIRVMGVASQEFQEFVLGVFEKHAPGFDRNAVIVRPSRKGNYESVTVKITATGEPQLQALFQELRANTHVKMVL